jgi:hypothetical protein
MTANDRAYRAINGASIYTEPSEPGFIDAEPWQRVAACRHLTACQAYLADCDTNGVQVHGVIAGQHRPWGPDSHPHRRPVGRPKSPCGTVAAYYRHIRHREPIDPSCRAAARKANAARQAKAGAA